MKKLLPYIAFILVLSVRLIFYFSGLPEYPNGTRIRISARVGSEPVYYSNSQYLKLVGFKVYLPLFPRVYYGDRVVVEGRVEDGKIISPELITIQEKKLFLYQYRQSLIAFYERNLPKDHSALVSGIVIGSKGGIGEDLWNALKKSGTAHVVVASGMNVTLLAGFLMGLFVLLLPRRKAVVFTFIGIWIYAILSGFDAPIVRASVMGSAAFLAVGLGRMYRPLRILVFTALVLLLINPVWVADLGFWLSVFATASIIVFYPWVKKVFSFVPKILNEDWSTTLSAQIGVVPLLYYFFGQFNILSPVINVFVLWTIVPITIIGMLAGIVGTIIEPLGRIILILCYPLTSWFLFVIRSFA